MDIVKQLLADQAGPLVEKLTGQLGFSAEQAQGFVPAAVTQLIEAMKGGGIDLAGLLGGIVLCGLLARYQFIKLPSDVYYITTLSVRMEAFDVTVIIISALVISFLATLYPAWQASRLNPVEALRYE